MQTNRWVLIVRSVRWWSHHRRSQRLCLESPVVAFPRTEVPTSPDGCGVVNSEHAKLTTCLAYERWHVMRNASSKANQRSRVAALPVDVLPNPAAISMGCMSVQAEANIVPRQTAVPHAQPKVLRSSVLSTSKL